MFNLIGKQTIRSQNAKKKKLWRGIEINYFYSFRRNIQKTIPAAHWLVF